jgi:hypothetical protein
MMAYFSFFPHLMHLLSYKTCSNPHFGFGHLSATLLPQCSQYVSGNVALPQLPQIISSEKLQLPQTLEPFCIGLLHLGHLGGPVGSTVPQKGQIFASGSASFPQYLHGLL